jgi:diacylglycerol kinase
MEKNHSLTRSFRTAFYGIFRGLFYERNSRIQIVIATIIITLCAFLNITKAEYILIIGLCFLVILLELINTSFEKLLDVIYPKYHPEIGLIKDIMSGVVLLGALLSVAIGIVVLAEPFMALARSILGL